MSIIKDDGQNGDKKKRPPYGWLKKTLELTRISSQNCKITEYIVDVPDWLEGSRWRGPRRSEAGYERCAILFKITKGALGNPGSRMVHLIRGRGQYHMMSCQWNSPFTTVAIAPLTVTIALNFSDRPWKSYNSFLYFSSSVASKLNLAQNFSGEGVTMSSESMFILYTLRSSSIISCRRVKVIQFRRMTGYFSCFGSFSPNAISWTVSGFGVIRINDFSNRRHITLVNLQSMTIWNTSSGIFRHRGQGFSMLNQTLKLCVVRKFKWICFQIADFVVSVKNWLWSDVQTTSQSIKPKRSELHLPT